MDEGRGRNTVEPEESIVPKKPEVVELGGSRVVGSNVQDPPGSEREAKIGSVGAGPGMIIEVTLVPPSPTVKVDNDVVFAAPDKGVYEVWPSGRTTDWYTIPVVLAV